MNNAVSLKHVDAANQGQTDAMVSEDISFAGIPAVEDVASNVKYHIFKLAKNKKGRVHIDGICDNVMNPKTNKRERIYLLQGASSIWETDLEGILKDKESYKNRRRSLLFVDGVCRIRSDWENWLAFAKTTTHNVGKRRVGLGKFDFYEYDAAEEQKLRLARQTFKLETVIKVSKMDEEPMKKLASFVGVVFYDELGQPKSADGIRTELLIKADVQPELISKHIGSKEVEVSYLVKRAIIDAKIDLQGQSGNAIWANGAGFICKIPSARKPHEYLLELAMTNSDEGRKFKQQLETLIT
jgi:hypothetical protein